MIWINYVFSTKPILLKRFMSFPVSEPWQSMLQKSAIRIDKTRFSISWLKSSRVNSFHQGLKQHFLKKEVGLFLKYHHSGCLHRNCHRQIFRQGLYFCLDFQVHIASTHSVSFFFHEGFLRQQFTWRRLVNVKNVGCDDYAGTLTARECWQSAKPFGESMNSKSHVFKTPSFISLVEVSTNHFLLDAECSIKKIKEFMSSLAIFLLQKFQKRLIEMTFCDFENHFSPQIHQWYLPPRSQVFVLCRPMQF